MPTLSPDKLNEARKYAEDLAETLKGKGYPEKYGWVLPSGSYLPNSQYGATHSDTVRHVLRKSGLEVPFSMEDSYNAAMHHLGWMRVGSFGEPGNTVEFRKPPTQEQIDYVNAHMPERMEWEKGHYLDKDYDSGIGKESFLNAARGRPKTMPFDFVEHRLPRQRPSGDTENPKLSVTKTGHHEVYQATVPSDSEPDKTHQVVYIPKTGYKHCDCEGFKYYGRCYHTDALKRSVDEQDDPFYERYGLSSAEKGDEEIGSTRAERQAYFKSYWEEWNHKNNELRDRYINAPKDQKEEAYLAWRNHLASYEPGFSTKKLKGDSIGDREIHENGHYISMPMEQKEARKLLEWHLANGYNGKLQASEPGYPKGYKQVHIFPKEWSSGGKGYKEPSGDEAPVYYHTTTPENAASIRKNGFSPAIGERTSKIGSNIQANNAPGVFLYKNDREAAEWFAQNFDGGSEIVEADVRGKLLNTSKPPHELTKDYIDLIRDRGYVGVNGKELGQPYTFVFDGNAVKPRDIRITGDGRPNLSDFTRPHEEWHRNYTRTAAILPHKDGNSPCTLCGRMIRNADENAYFIRHDIYGNLRTPDEPEDEKDQGCFPVGPECRKNIPKGYLIPPRLKGDDLDMVVTIPTSTYAIIYHSQDFDGICSGAIALMKYPTATLYPWTYGDPVPEVSTEDHIFMLDVSIPEIMDRPNLIWIDHHKSAIEQYEVSGKQVIGVSAARLCWQYFFGNKEASLEDFEAGHVVEPTSVKLIGLFDVHDQTDPDAETFQYGLTAANFKVEQGSLLTDEDWTWSLIEQGRLIKPYVDNINIKGALEHAYLVEWEGLTWWCLNGTGYSAAFDGLDMTQADGLMMWNVKGEIVHVSLYQVPGKDADMSEIATRFGGGGHRGASGFRTDFAFLKELSPKVGADSFPFFHSTTQAQADWHNAQPEDSRGSTWAYYGEHPSNVDGTDAWSVGVRGHSKIYGGSTVEPRQIQRFANENRELLEDGHHALGTWYDPEGKKTYLDVVELHKNREEAERAAKHYNQIGIFNLSSHDFVDIGGTGK